MTFRSGVTLVGLVGLACCCLEGCSDPGSQSGTGGATGSGGVASSGGATGSGGVASTGGATGSGGVASTGGAPGTGGTPGSGGGAPSGGATGSGGVGATASGGTAGGGAGAGPGGKTGSGGAAGSLAAGAGGSDGGGGAAGGSGDGWVSILPTDDALTGWIPLIKPYPAGMDPLKTFRRDSNGYLVVSYADYPNGDFAGHFGLLYYDKVLTNYKVRVEYRFQEPQIASGRPSWGKNNSGLMVFCTDPRTVTGNPDFPPSIEIQLLGNPSAGGSINCQLCLNGSNMYVTMLLNQKITGPGGCFKSLQNASDFQPAATWVTVEADVQATGTTNVYQYPDTTKAIMSFSGVTLGSKMITSGYLSLQSESQPIQFRKVELMDLGK